MTEPIKNVIHIRKFNYLNGLCIVIIDVVPSYKVFFLFNIS